MPNQLADESSPYLQQHKNNPVNWYPWGKEAFEKAREEDKLLFISIGYSSCHWCHVMARESFEDEETAQYLNDHFISIKVDREEYPGIDKAYQEMFQMIHQRGGGWPLSVWAQPDGTPFYIGTYFPDSPRHNMPSFMDVNQRIVKLWQEEPDALQQQGGRLAIALKQMGEGWNNNHSELTEDLYYKEIIGIQRRFDETFGGIGTAPKFPHVSTLRFLLREGLYKDIPDIVDFVSFTFHKMAKGGIYDQLGGGFARYSVDRQWLVPHFEKMLYDNGALIKLGAELAEINGDQFIEFIVKDTINWLAREMRHEHGGFYSALNAESEGREGAYYVWYQDELQELLGDHYPLAAARYGISKEGNFEDPHHPEITGMNILSLSKSIQQLGEEFDQSEEEIIAALQQIRKILFEHREHREKPSTDTKILTSWNCIAIRGLLTAGELLEYPQATKLAVDALNFLLEYNVTKSMVRRKYMKSTEDFEDREIDGILDDYSFMMAALIDAYEHTDNFDYILTADKILKLTDTKFYDEAEGIYFLNPSTSEDLFNRVVQVSDDSMESGLGVLVYVLFKLGKYLEKPELISRGDDLINKLSSRYADYPGATSTLLNSASMYLRYPDEIVMVHPTAELNDAVLSSYTHNRLIYRYDGQSSDKPDWEVLENRTDRTEPTVFICRGQTCSLPLTSAEQVKNELSLNS